MSDTFRVNLVLLQLNDNLLSRDHMRLMREHMFPYLLYVFNDAADML